VFAVGHLENLDEHASTADVITTLVAVTLLGAMWSLVFVVTRSLWAACANHAAWNFAIILTGIPLSGVDDWLSLAPIASRYNGPDWLTGGQFGPENSLVTIVLVCAAVVVLWKLAKSRNRLVTAQTPGREGELASAT
jgi:membrane protease YdiL (CAAX protease family)